MTISATTTVQQYTGTGANTSLSTVFKFFVNADVVVTRRVTATGVDTTMVLGVNYSMTGGSVTGATGTVTPLDGSTDFTSSMTWSIERLIPITQDLDYVENDIFSADSHEAGLDRLTMQNQDREQTLSRALRFPATDVTSLTSQLPNSVLRASKALTFDSAGNATVTTPDDASGTSVTATGSTTDRTLQERFAEVANVKDFGAKGDGVTNDNAALVAAEAALGDVYIPPSSSFYVFTQTPDITKTWGEGVCKVSGNRVYLRPTPESANKILASIFDIPLAPTDGAPALQRAIDYAQLVHLPLELPYRQKIQTNSTIVISQGAIDLADFNANGVRHLTLLGNNAFIKPNVNGAGIDIRPLASFAEIAITPGIQFGEISIENLTIQGEVAEVSGHTSAYAMQIGKAGFQISGPEKKLIDRLTITNFGSGVMTGHALRITNAQLFAFKYMVINNNGGMLIHSPDNVVAAFTGDLNFYSCWFTGSLARPPIEMRGNDTASGIYTKIAGVIFRDCQVLDGGTKLHSGSADSIRRISFGNCEFDVGVTGTRAVDILCEDDGIIDMIKFNECSFAQFKAACLNIKRTGATSRLDMIDISNCLVLTLIDGGGDTVAVMLDGVTSATVTNMAFRDLAVTGAAIHIVNSDHCAISGCVANLPFATNVDFIKITDDTTCDDWFIVGNAASVSGTGKVVNLIKDTTTGEGFISDNRIAGSSLALTSVASATSIALANTAEESSTSITITGSTLVSNITGGKAGQLLSIIWASAATFDVGDEDTGDGEFHLTGGANLTTHTATDTLLLVSDGTDWYEISRNDNS